MPKINYNDISSELNGGGGIPAVEVGATFLSYYLLSRKIMQRGLDLLLNRKIRSSPAYSRKQVERIRQPKTTFTTATTDARDRFPVYKAWYDMARSPKLDFDYLFNLYYIIYGYKLIIIGKYM